MSFVQILEKDDASSTLPESEQIALLMDFRNEALPLSLHFSNSVILSNLNRNAGRAAEEQRYAWRHGPGRSSHLSFHCQDLSFRGRACA